ncbi:hypothetical protein QQS21_008674 [Conoideocrella luteorostrata]|uniref:Uncharacterized protein n=1 Tax=Conoideocrella luteorostrata TaxID=1105319 RepID=A0AAJ0CIF8_9HYPO|nr:hypothetical protein QQS21_008674 [Conoideocrella luteorostrata]
MRILRLTQLAFTGILCAEFFELAFAAPPGFLDKHNPSGIESNRLSALDKRLELSNLVPEELRSLGKEAIQTIYDIYEAAKKAKKIKEFLDSTLKIKPGQVQSLSKNVGKNALKKIRYETPGQPGNVVLAFLLGIGGCALEGKSSSEIFECGKSSVRELGDNTSIEVPEPCNNRLGQFELLNTGWPAKCHDPNTTQHPAGNSAKRWLLRGACSLFETEKFAAAARRRGEQSCDERFPSDGMLEADKAKKEAMEKILERAKTELISHYEKVQKWVTGGGGGQIGKGDIDKTAKLITQGTLGAEGSEDWKAAYKLAGRFMGSLKNAEDQITWAIASRVPAKNITIDKDVSKNALRLATLKKGMFKDTLIKDSDLCYSPAGLAEFQPSADWQPMLTALDLVDKQLWKKKFLCKACDVGAGSWALGCSSAAQKSKDASEEAPTKPKKEPGQGKPEAT